MNVALWIKVVYEDWADGTKYHRYDKMENILYIIIDERISTDYQVPSDEIIAKYLVEK